MLAHEPLSFNTLAATGPVEEVCYATRPATETAAPWALRYSSPWPWVLALAISSTMWVGIGWLVWTFV
jgi:hypothetical protein